MRQSVIYLRASKDRVGAGVGIARQEAEIRDHAARLGIGIDAAAGTDGVFTDNDMSAYSGKPRSGYQAMISYITACPRDVLVWHTDRLHRSPRELEDYIDVVDPRGIITRAVRAGLIDLATPSGRLFARQLGGFARFESEQMSDRWKARKRQDAADGKWLGGRRPYGFRPLGGGLLEVDMDEAAVVLWAADQLLAGAAIRWVTRELRERGAVTSTGAEWSAWSLRNMLLRPSLAGLMVHGGEIVGRASWGRWMDDAGTQWGAVLTEARWRALTGTLRNPARKTSRGWVRRHLGSGLYECGICGAPMRFCGNGGGGAYRCIDPAKDAGRHVSRDAVSLDEYVTGWMLEWLADNLPAVAAAVPDASAPPADDPARLRARLNEAAELHALGVIDGEQLAAGSRVLRARLAAADAASGASAAHDPLSPFRPAALAAMPREARLLTVRRIWEGDSYGAEGLSVPQRQAVVRVAATVTVLPARPGKTKGWEPGQRAFRPEYIRIEPVRQPDNPSSQGGLAQCQPAGMRTASPSQGQPAS